MNIFKRLEAGVLTREPEQTMELARKFVDALPDNQVIALSGDLGSGKTTFTKGAGIAFGIETAHIKSPTFNLYHIHEGNARLIHIDAYRLDGDEAVEDLLIEEFLGELWLVVIEWPEKGMADWMKSIAWTLRFNLTDEGTRITLVDQPEDR